jgi:hypothetical protein
MGMPADASYLAPASNHLTGTPSASAPRMPATAIMAHRALVRSPSAYLQGRGGVFRLGRCTRASTLPPPSLLTT